MSNRTMEFGIRITADGRVAVTETGRVTQSFKGIDGAARQAAAGGDRLADSIKRIGQYGAALAGLGGITVLARQAIAGADAMTNLESRIRLVTHSTIEQYRAQEEIYRISQTTRQSLAATGDLYFKIAKGADALGLSQAQVLALTQSVSQAMALSGASAESSKAAVMQFGQALASGALRGDELNSVMEQAPALAEAIAKGMGKTVGELRALGEQGKITVGEIVTALEKQAPEIARQFGEITPTVGAAWQQLSNSALKYVGDADKASGATHALAGSIQFAAQHVDALAAVSVAGLALGLGRLVGVKAAAGLAAMQLAQQQQALALSTTSLNAALGMQAARTTATTAAATGAHAIMGALGGPIGIVTTALTLGATAWTLWGNSSKNAGAVASATMREVQEEAAKTGREAMVIAQQKLLDARRAWEDAGMKASGEERKEFVRWEAEVQRIEAFERNLAERMAKATTGEAWAKAFMTPAEKKREAIAELDKLYVTEVTKLGSNQQAILTATADYHRKRAELDRQFANKGAKAAHDDIADMGREQALAYAKLYTEAAKYTQGLEDQEKAGRKLTKAEELLLEVERKLPPQWAAAIKALLARASAIETNTKADVEALEFTRERAKLAAGEYQDIAKQLEAKQRENEEIGLTVEQLQQLTARRYDEQIAKKQAILLDAEANPLRAAEVFYIREQIAALEKLRDATLSGAQKQAAANLGKEMAGEFAQLYEGLEDGLGRALMDGTVDGLDDAGEVIKRWLKAMATQMILRPLIQPVFAQAAEMFGVDMRKAGGSWAQMGSGGGGVGGYGNLPSMFGNMGSSIMFGSTGGFGLSAGASLAGGSGLYGSFAASSVGEMLGLSAVTTTAEGVAISGLTSTGASLGAGLSTIAAAMPYIAAALAVASLFMGKGGGPKTEMQGGDNVGYFGGDPSHYAPNAQIDTVVKGVKNEYDALLQRLGVGAQSLRLNISGDSDPQGDAPDSAGFALAVGDQERSSVTNFGRGEWNQQAGLQTITSRALLAALEATDLDDVIDAYLDTLDVAALSSEQAVAAIQTAQAMDFLIDTLGEMGQATDIVTAEMAEYLGPGLSAIMQSGVMTAFEDLEQAIADGNRSLYDAWRGQTGALDALMAGYDGSTASASALANGLSAFGQTTMQVLQQVAQVRGQTEAMFQDSIRGFQYSVLDNEGKYGFLDEEIDQYITELKGAFDPAKINELAAKINADLNAAFGLLDPEEQRAHSADFVDRAGTVESLVAGQLDAVGALARADRSALNQQIVDIVTAAVTRMQEQAAAAAAAQSAAAGDLAAAAGRLNGAAAQLSDAAPAEVSAG